MLKHRIVRGTFVALLSTLMATSAMAKGKAAAKPAAKKPAAAAPKAAAPKAAAGKPAVAFYVCDTTSGEYAKGATADAAAAECKKKDPGCTCDKGKALAVKGPYSTAEAQKMGGDKGYEYCDEKGQTCFDKDGGMICFVAGTLVSTPSGERKIEEMQAGEEVYAYDVDSGARVVSKVEKTSAKPARRVMTLTLDDGSTLGVTPNHPFFLAESKEWVKASELQVGDTLLKIAGDAFSMATVKTLTSTESEQTVYNLTVEGQHNYFAGGVLVHNY